LLLSHTRLAGKYTLRLVAGQEALEFRHMEAAWETIRNAAALIESE
jgi:hypothetical protein